MTAIVGEKGIWARTDEARDVLGSLQHVLRTVQYLPGHELEWKWFVLALHSALQGACVCHLTTTAAPIGAVNEKNARDWVAYFEKQGGDAELEPPKTCLLAMPELLKKVRRKNQGAGGPIAINDVELKRLCGFHSELRNQFIHFEPCGWSIEVSGFPAIARLVARIIIDIRSDGWAFRHLDWQDLDALDARLSELSRFRIDRTKTN